MPLLLYIDPASRVTLNRQIYEGIRGAILSGRQRPGDRLPATRALAARLGLSRATVADAYDQLEAEGYVDAKRGSGTFVASNLPEAELASGRAVSPTSLASQSPLNLSPWGTRACAEQYATLTRAAEPETFSFDLRPHRIAQDCFPWEAWRASLDRVLIRERRRLLSYPPSAGHPDLVQEIARHVLKHRAVACSPDQIVVVNGSQQGLNLLAALLLTEGDAVAVEDPGYPAARLSFQAQGLKVERFPVDDEGLVVEDLRRSHPFKLVHVTPSHQEPTGATMSLGRRLSLLELGRETGCLILEDDYDSEFRYEGRPVEPLQALDTGGRVIYAGTFSKSVLPGLRIGFLILPLQLVPSFVAAKSLWDSGAPILEQAALADFMRSGEYERHIRRVRRLYRDRRDTLVTELTGALGSAVAIGRRAGGLNLLISLDVGLSESEIIRRCAREGVGLRGASAYYREPPASPTFLLGFGGATPFEIKGGVRAMAQAVMPEA